MVANIRAISFMRRLGAYRWLRMPILMLSTLVFFLLFLRLSTKDAFDYFPTWSNSVIRYSVDQDIPSSTAKSKQQPGCIIPQLKLNDSDIMQYLQIFEPLSCGKSPGNGDDFDWVDLRSGHVIFNNEAVKIHGALTCNLTEITRLSDFETMEAKWSVRVENGSVLNHDFHKVTCTAADGSKYLNYQAGIHHNPEIDKRRQKANPGGYGLDLDVIIIGHDSLSNMAWKRHLPLTRDYLVNTLKVVEMEGHTIVGDGTPATIFPLLTGKREEDLPEARRGYPSAQPVDNYPWIFNPFSNAGYVTAWQEDAPDIGTFTYRLLGFEQSPVDHYYRPYAIYRDSHKKEFEPHCTGTKPNIVLESNYAADLFRVYNGPDHRRFIFTFKSENSHENNNDASKFDLYLKNHLVELYTSGFLDNALLMVFSDHGARFSKIRAFAQGKLEERMPYMAIRLPESFKYKHPVLASNIVHNSQRLTTPFDVYETLREVLNYTGVGPADISKRGVSLFKRIPEHRDCKSADVDSHWCFCLDWSPVAVDSQIIMRAASYVVNLINSEVDKRRDLCSTLKLKNIVQAFRSQVRDDVLKFKDTDDGGRGRFGKMTDTTQQKSVVYQVTFETTPGDGLFEVTTTFDVKSDQFVTDIKTISRINKYGSAPWCIMKNIPQLRPYCHCKQPAPSGW